FGGHGEGETPGPIPNPEVKLFSADGTARGTAWESRTPPDIVSEGRFRNGGGPHCCVSVVCRRGVAVCGYVVGRTVVVEEDVAGETSGQGGEDSAGRGSARNPGGQERGAARGRSSSADRRAGGAGRRGGGGPGTPRTGPGSGRTRDGEAGPEGRRAAGGR